MTVATTMYLPRQFDSKDLAHALQIMRAQPFASLISTDDEGLPYVSHIPLHVEVRAEAAAGFVLLGHVAKPNPHWRYLLARPHHVVTFMGPQAYMSPKVYPDLARVPTWNYLAVHCTVQATLIEDPLAKDRLLKKLIGDHEPAFKQQWIDLGLDYQHKMLAGIVGFELQVQAVQCKIKINQHRSEAHAAMYAAYSQGTPDEKNLALWMQQLGMAAGFAN